MALRELAQALDAWPAALVAFARSLRYHYAMATRPRILVLQPFITEGAPLDYRLLGLQFWLADRFTDIGLEGASALCRAPESEALVSSSPPTDEQLRRTLIENAAQYGLVTSFVVLGARPHLAIARLVRAQRGHPLRMLARWKFEGESEHLPAAAHRLLVEIAPRLGVGLRPSTWAQVFDTDDGAIAGNFLTALGCHAACDQGFAVDEPEAALRALLSAISRRMGPAIELLPHFVKSLRSSGSAPTEMLRAAVDAALEIVGEPPPSWQPMLGELGSGRPALLN